MRDQCVEAITQAAVKMGRKVDSVYLRNIEDKFIKAKTQLARQDREKWAGMSEAERLNKAGDLVAQDMIHEGIKKRQRLERQMVKEAEKRAALDKMEQRLGKLEALQRFTWTIRDNRGGVETMERRSNAISSNMMRKLTDLWELERSNLVNLFTDKKVQMDLMMELYGQDSGNPLAKKAAEGYKKVVDKAIKDMNDLGFDVKLLESWRSPQKMSFYRIWDAVTPSILERRGKTAKEIEVMMNDRRMAVAKDMLPHIDRKMMVNLDGTLMDDVAVLKFLDEGLKSILTNGMNKESGSGAGSMLAKRHSQERQFHWKSPESFMYVMGKYSDSNPIDMMWSAFENIGREMAMVEKFGPNAVDGFNTEIERLANAGVPANKLRKEIGLFEAFIGTQNQSASPRLDRTLQNLRQMMGAVYLGSNTISQMVDQVTLLATARAMNIPMVEVFMRQGKLLADSGERSMLRSMGAGLETAAQGIARLSDQGGALFGAKATNAVLTLNLSNYLTSIPRMAMYGAVVDHIGNLTRQADSFSKLGNGDRMLMEARGLTDEQWSIFREAGKDGKLTPDAIEALPDDQVLKLIPEKVEAIQAEMKTMQGKGRKSMSREDVQKQLDRQYALAANKARNDALYQLIGIALDESHMASTQPSFRSTHALDQYVGDSSILKLMTQFKSFPIAFFMQHIMERGLGGGHGVGNKWAYTASLVTASTVMGGVALLLSDLAAGRDPREVVDEEGKPNAKFMAQAFFKGGGLGIVGDLFNTENWEGQDPIGSQMGPGVGYIVDLAQLGLAAGQYAAAEAGSSDEEKARKRMGSEGTRVLRSSIPGQNIWWARGVFNNLLLKDVNEFMSPGYSERAQQRAEKNYSSQYFIGGDEGVRAPNLSNIMGRD